MSTLTRPRGPLPPKVYWTRRLIVVGLALLLVVGIGRLLTLGSDGSGGGDQARQAAGEPTGAGTPSTSSTSRPENRKNKKKRKKNKPTTPVLAEPTGPCASSDIVVQPTVKEAVGGSDVLITLELSTKVTEACTWTVSPDSMTMKITSGADEIWTSRECPAAIPTQDVVVRREVVTPVGVQWNARRSDDGCTVMTEWAFPGFYHVVAAALAGEPTDLQFELVKPPRPIVTKTITPSPTPTPEGKKKRKNP